jgi:hypothetical protein
MWHKFVPQTSQKGDTSMKARIIAAILAMITIITYIYVGFDPEEDMRRNQEEKRGQQ